MRIQVLLFARLRELVGRESLDLDLPDGTTVGEVWRRVQGQAAAVADYPRMPLAAVNQEYARSETVLAVGDEVAFFPPVSGG